MHHGIYEIPPFGVTNDFQRFSPSTCTVKLENELYVLETAKLNAFIYQEGGKKSEICCFNSPL